MSVARARRRIRIVAESRTGRNLAPRISRGRGHHVDAELIHAMRLLSRVVWHEGMHLSQHHFQTQSRYFEDAIHFALSQLFFRPYGVASCELDGEALRNGTASLVRTSGILPDGTPFHMPDSDRVPLPRDIREIFSPTHESHRLLLALPQHQRDGANVALDGGARNGGLRFQPERREVRDETTGHDTREVDVGRRAFRLVLEHEATPDDVTLPLARVTRDGAGGFVYDPDFIPPSLQIAASSRLLQMVRRVVEILDAKADAMARDRRAAGRSLAEYASHEVANFWLQHAVHSSMAPLRHHLAVRTSHPEAVFLEMSRLAGALCTFALDAHPRDLPLYDHDDLGACFGSLERHVRAQLEVIVPTSSVRVPLERVSEILFTGRITDERVFGPGRWLLGVRSSAGDAAVAARGPQLLKVCSARFVLELVKRARTGLSLEHVPVPPAAAAPRSDTQYFALGRAGPCWDTLLQLKEIGVYVPDAFPDAELDLVVVPAS